MQKQQELEKAEQRVATLRAALAATPEGRQLTAQWNKWQAASRQRDDRVTPLPPDESQKEEATINELGREYRMLKSQWPVARNTIEDLAVAEFEVFNRSTFMGMLLHTGVWRCLPTEALPPGMLPLRKAP
jgi:hypothetical protein